MEKINQRRVEENQAFVKELESVDVNSLTLE